MPIPSDYKVPMAEGKFDVLPADVYQVVITEVELLRNQLNPFSGKTQDQLKFSMRVVNEEQKNGQLVAFMSAKWFDGRKGSQSSKLFTLVKAVYDYYQKDVKITELKPEEVVGEKINELLGKQVKVVVEEITNSKDQKRNKISSFMPIKKELKYEPEPSLEEDASVEEEEAGDAPF